jgi:hypothetical protein
MERSKAVFAAVSTLYQSEATRGMGRWMWRNHVQWVASRATELANKYGASAEKVYCAALLHDLGDSQHERTFENFATWSEDKGREILLGAGFSKDEATEIVEVIIRPHSCRRGNLPTTIEGKVLATADAMWHLQTNFFPVLCFMNRPETISSYEEWQEWFNEKSDREISIKIFFEDERTAVKDDYEALVKVFSNTTLDSNDK